MKISASPAISVLIFTILIVGCIGPEIQSSKVTPAKTPAQTLTPFPTATPTPTPTPLPVPTPTPVPGIAPTPLVLPAIIETDKPSYLRGEQVRIKVTLRNTLSDEITVNSPEIRIEGMLDNPAKVFPSGSKKIRLKKGESVSFEAVWKQADALPGSYTIRVVPTRVENCNMCFFSGQKEILITYPRGALNKTLNLNLTKDGLTLQKIVFTPERTDVYLRTKVPVVYPEVPGNIPPPLPTPPDVLMSYSAKLKVDGTYYPIRQYGYKPDGNWTVIFLTSPLPKDAKRLSFAVKNSESLEFDVNLR
ncbi:MAG: hypothetical protein H0Z28_11460 [Archaeoglobus sp.]|nr:hypothetical protein [Archaeoglobus sp.]